MLPVGEPRSLKTQNKRIILSRWVVAERGVAWMFSGFVTG